MMYGTSTRFARAGMAAALAVTAFLPLAPASAQEHRHDRERDRYQTPHWVFDDRYHHGHYYPSVGYSMTVLPAGNIAISFRGGRFFFQSGVWFQPARSGYVVVRPPVGIVVPVLPPAYTMVWAGGAPYYYANDVYYMQAPGGYAVAAPPAQAAQMAADQPPAPVAPPPPAGTAPGAAGPSASGTWFYCESAKGYYPYVSDCKEGWRSVPASPPPAR